MADPVRKIPALLCASLFALAFTACAKTVSTSFPGERHEVAQTISNLQADVTARDETKVCTADLASAVVARLNGASGGCKLAMKRLLAEVDSTELSVKSVQVNANAAPPTATAKVTSVYSGKTRPSTISLVKEAGKWKISEIQ
jgi:hypothetical protein